MCIISKTLTQHLTIDDLHGHIPIEFIIEEKVAGLKIKVSCNQYPNTKINTMLYDTNSYRGMIDKDKSEAMIKEDFATEGMLCGKIDAGVWKCVLDIAKINSDSIVYIEYTLYLEEDKWYEGDIHTHTTHSDGEHSIEEAVNIAGGQQLDFIVLSDHNTFSQNINIPAYEHFTLLPGVELTTSKGHTNFIGVEKTFKAFDYSNHQSVMDLFKEGFSNGAFISINHPLIGDRWKWGFEGLSYHALEIWNGTPLSRNKEVLEWWQARLCEGKKILGVGGSDVHRQGLRNRCYGQGRTLIYAKSNSRRHLMEGLHTGHICVAASYQSSRGFFTINQCMIGDTLILEAKENNENLLLEFILDIRQDSLLKIYGDTGIVHTQEVNIDTKIYACELPSNSKFYRMELWNKTDNEDKYIPFFTNPIYIEG